jgi:nucleotide-binding universal stress UspA family protein
MLLLVSTDSSIAGSAATRVAAELAERLRIDLSSPDVDARDLDPSRRLLAAAHATGCDLLVVGYASRAAVETASTPGWQRRVVRDTPPPVMLVPGGAVPPSHGGLMLGCGASALPRQAAATAARLARRLRTVLTLTDVLTSDWKPYPSGWPLSHGARVPEREAEYASSATVHPRQVLDELPSDQMVRPATMQEAALVVIAGRRAGRGLLPRRNVGHRPLAGAARLPVIVAAPRTPAVLSRSD